MNTVAQIRKKLKIAQRAYEVAYRSHNRNMARLWLDTIEYLAAELKTYKGMSK